MTNEAPRQEAGQAGKLPGMHWSKGGGVGYSREMGAWDLHEHDILDQATVPTGREIKQTIKGTTLENAKVRCAGPLRLDPIRWFDSEHVDERKASPSILAEKFQPEEILTVLPDALVLVHEVTGSDFDTLSVL